MSLSPFVLIGLPVLTIIAAGMVGRTRKLGFWLTVLISVFLTPIVGFAVAVISGPKPWPGRQAYEDKQREKQRRRRRKQREHKRRTRERAARITAWFGVEGES